MKFNFILFLLFCSAFKVKAQNNSIDTINLLKTNILNHKSTLKGQPFEVLLQRQPSILPIKSYFPGSGTIPRTIKTEFSFVNRSQIGRSKIALVVYWQDSTRSDKAESDHFGESKPIGSWKQIDIDFYKNWIIKDVHLYVIGVGGHEIE